MWCLQWLDEDCPVHTLWLRPRGSCVLELSCPFPREASFLPQPHSVSIPNEESKASVLGKRHPLFSRKPGEGGAKSCLQRVKKRTAPWNGLSVSETATKINSGSPAWGTKEMRPEGNLAVEPRHPREGCLLHSSSGYFTETCACRKILWLPTTLHAARGDGWLKCHPKGGCFYYSKTDICLKCIHIYLVNISQVIALFPDI